MTDGAMRRIDKNYGDSPVWRGSVPIASSLFESCLRIPRSQLRSGLHHQHAAQPRGSPSGRQWSPGLPSQARARDLAPTLCRALMMQAASGRGLSASNSKMGSLQCCSA